MDGPFGLPAGPCNADRSPQVTRPLAQFVKARRLALRLSQADVSVRCGVSQKTISLIEAGRTLEPRLALLDRLAGALDTSRETLEQLLLSQAGSVSDIPPPKPAPNLGLPVAALTRPPAVTGPPPPSAGLSGLQQARALIDELLVQAVNPPSDIIVSLVRQTAGYLATEFGAPHRADRPSIELAIDSAWVVGRTYANVTSRQVHDGDAFFDRAAAMARQIDDWDRWAQAVWRKANHYRKFDDLVVAQGRLEARQARPNYDLALAWLDDVLASSASAAWRSVAHAEYAKIAISTGRETVFAQHIAEARRLAAHASNTEAPAWPPYLPEYAEVLWRDRYLLGLALYDAGSEAEMGRIIEEARRYRNGLTAPFDQVMLPLSQTLRDIRSRNQDERERGAKRGWRVILSARRMGLENFVRLTARALTEAGLLEVGRRLYAEETRAARQSR